MKRNTKLLNLPENKKNKLSLITNQIKLKQKTKPSLITNLYLSDFITNCKTLYLRQLKSMQVQFHEEKKGRGCQQQAN